MHAKNHDRHVSHNFDAMVTKDYLESRFSEFETRVEATMDRRFSDMESRVDKRFALVDLRLERMDGRFNLLYWMQAITIACVVVPVIHEFLG